MTFNAYDYWRLRELGGSPPYCKQQAPNVWSRENQRRKWPIERLQKQSCGVQTSLGMTLEARLQSARSHPPLRRQHAHMTLYRFLEQTTPRGRRIEYERARRRFYSVAAHDEGNDSDSDSDDFHIPPPTKKPRLPSGNTLNNLYEEATSSDAKHPPPPDERYRMVSTDDFLKERIGTHMPMVFVEKKINLGHVNKIFASAWLPNDRIVMGSKCNKILVYDVKKRSLAPVPTLPSNSPQLASGHCGIHTISVNPSGTLLATGSDHPADLAIYRLPSFEPVTVGGFCHRDWIFASEWLDDEFLVSGSRDSSLALWRFHERPVDHIDCDHVTWLKAKSGRRFPVTTPVVHQSLVQGDKIRAFACNSRHKVLTSISLNSYLNVLDLETLCTVRVEKLDNQLTECVCAVTSPDQLSTVIGSRSFFSFFDGRTAEPLFSERLPDGRHHSMPGTAYYHNFPHGVRSLSWHGHTITVGTGQAEVLFYDIRARDFVHCTRCRDQQYLVAGQDGWHMQSEIFDQIFRDAQVPNAVYTHAYDPTRTRLFTAGGPIAATVMGNFAAIFD